MDSRRFQEALRLRPGLEQLLNPLAQFDILGASTVEVSVALARRGDVRSIPEDVIDALRIHDGRLALSACPLDSAKKGGGAPHLHARISGSLRLPLAGDFT